MRLTPARDQVSASVIALYFFVSFSRPLASVFGTPELESKRRVLAEEDEIKQKKSKKIICLVWRRCCGLLEPFRLYLRRAKSDVNWN